MNIRQTDSGDWSLESRALFRSARADHAPSAADRARLRAALARLLANAPDSPPTIAKGRASPESLAKIGLATVMAAMIAVVLAGTRKGDEQTTRQNAPAPLPMVASARGTAAEPPPQEAQPAAPAGQAPAPAVVARAESAPSIRQAKPALRAAGAASRATRPAAAPPPPSAAATSAASAPAASGSLESAPAASGSFASAAAARSSVAPVSLPSPPSALAARRGPTEGADAGCVGCSSQVPAAPSRLELARPAVSRSPAPAPARPPAARLAASPALDPLSLDSRAELAFLQRIDAAMRANAATRVLSLCAEHQRRWPHGSFVQEREGLHALASCRVGALEAADRVRAFLGDYPSSPLAPRVRRACAAQLGSFRDTGLILPGPPDEPSR